MVLSAHRVLIFVICIELLATHPDAVYGLTSRDMALKRSMGAEGPLLHTERVLKDAAMQGMNTARKSARSNEKFDPNQSSKRRVRRGSDPIHNRT